MQRKEKNASVQDTPSQSATPEKSCNSSPWTAEKLDFARRLRKTNLSMKELTNIINKHFDCNHSKNSVVLALKRRNDVNIWILARNFDFYLGWSKRWNRAKEEI